MTFKGCEEILKTFDDHFQGSVPYHRGTGLFQETLLELRNDFENIV
jgi:hypothetical protein